MAIPTLFQLLFKWNIFFYPLAFDLHVSLNIKQGSYRQHLVGYFSFMKVFDPLHNVIQTSAVLGIPSGLFGCLAL